MALVFQYGSNTSTTRLNSKNRLAGAAKSLGLAQTEEEFELDFTYYSRSNGCAAADLTIGGSKKIYGVLYEIPDEKVFRSKAKGARTLDDIEGEGTAYKRTTIRVTPVETGQGVREALTYLVKNPVRGLRTNIQYVRHIIEGLREHGAPDEYIVYVKERAAQNNPCSAAELVQL